MQFIDLEGVGGEISVKPLFTHKVSNLDMLNNHCTRN